MGVPDLLDELELRFEPIHVLLGLDQEPATHTARITLGDSPEYFEATMNETGNRNARAQQSQTAGPAR